MAKLKEQIRDINVNGRISRLRDEMLCTPELCTERGYLITDSYRETECDPPIIRRAKALAKVLTQMPVLIENGQLIAGVATSKQRGGPIIPELHWDWYLDEMETISTREWDRFAPLTEDEKKRLREFLPYWKGRSLYEKWRSLVPKEFFKYLFKTFLPASSPVSNMHQAHTCPSYERVLLKGLMGIRKEIEEHRAKLDPVKIADLEKVQFYEAAVITIDSAMAFGKRYAALAKSMANNEADTNKKRELEKIAHTCEWVSENPARSFYEALQATWLTYIVVMNENWGPGQSFGRMDQYLYSFYKKDVENNVITREEACDLLKMFFIKLNGLTTPFCDEYVRGQPGFAMLSCITIGGVDEKGNDAVNDLSYLFLEAEEEIGLTSEEIVVRINRNNPDAFLIKACEVAKKLRGKLKFVGDEAIIEQFLFDGKPVQYARDYVITGCFIPAVPGRSHDYGGDFLNLALILELALNNGVSRVTGEQLGLETGDPRKFKTYDEVWEAFKKQIAFQIRQLIPIRIVYAKLFAEFCQYPFMSSLYEQCVEKGIDWSNGGTAPYNTYAIWVSGSADAGDSLAGIKKVVFDNKKLTMDRLITALDNNFEREKDIQSLLRKAPKFGNDDDYVDTLVNDVLSFTSDEAAKYCSVEGAKSNIAAGTTTTFLPLGYMVGALPNGRKATEPIADGGLSPAQGSNISGPTATMKSVAKLDHLKITGGSVLNMRFSQEALKDESKMKKFAALLRTYFEGGGHLVQFNFTDSATFRRAQKNPDKYRDLLVRVATYSAYFVDLPKELQDDIIARTEFQEI
jgi:pyruvate formate-lyase/glycerol dehydratase family glycyl radical enzyme